MHAPIASYVKRGIPLLVVMTITGCASSSFVSSSTAPDAQPLALKGAKVAAVVMMDDQGFRRVAEDTLAQEVSNQGATGIPMYSIYADKTPSNEPAAREALEKAAVQGVVVMRPVTIERDAVATPVTYSEPMYREYWGSYYGAGWGTPYGMATVQGGDVLTNTTVSVETLVYSLKQNKLIWSGLSKHTNPSDLEKTIKKLAKSAAQELRAQGLIAGP